MKATMVDLKYKMGDVLKALDRNETVTILYRGKVKGILTPADKHRNTLKKISEHPFFGMSASETSRSVTEELDTLREFRYDDI
jgi:hypothetical protein